MGIKVEWPRDTWPDGTVVLDNAGGAWQRDGGVWNVAAAEDDGSYPHHLGFVDLLREWGPLDVIYTGEGGRTP